MLAQEGWSSLTDVAMADGIDKRLLIAIIDLGRTSIFAQVFLRNLAAFDDGVLIAQYKGVDDGVADLLGLVTLPRVRRKFS